MTAETAFGSNAERLRALKERYDPTNVFDKLWKLPSIEANTAEGSNVMTTNSGILPADTITKAEFDKLLSQYPSLIETISEAKNVKKGQKSLRELDDYRYGEALSVYSADKSPRSMELDDVKALVERHGKFRPTLMKYVTSNDPVTAKSTIQEAISLYRSTSDVPAALALLTKLKGIGPATASLLLTVHDPDKVIFFSDEAYYWLCCDGTKSSIKYTATEYADLRSRAEDLAGRLGVAATDVEKVAYVVMKQPVSQVSAEASKSSTVSKREAPNPKNQDSEPQAPKAATSKSVKRKVTPVAQVADDTNDDAPLLRRSKRTRV
ncbi:hypothetical protein G7046_g3246 [Stylonectria norvegica]|nr:hypothetical protein G7046_g3246 [Stylonectria norvegica]